MVFRSETIRAGYYWWIRMKLVLLVLSGDPASARERVRMLFPAAEIENLARAKVERSTTGRVCRHYARYGLRCW